MIFSKKHWKWSARIVLDDPKFDTWNKPYNAKIYAKDSNWKEIMKSWWKPIWNSTFFPDNWEQKRIMEEVEYAMKNNKGKKYQNGNSHQQIFINDFLKIEKLK